MSSIGPFDSKRFRSFCRLDNFSFAFLLIALFNLIIFSPSFWHFFYGDDWSIFSGSLGMQHTSPAGDPNHLLFNPLCHALLAAELYLFGNNAFLWHLVGILMHLFVIFVFLKLLRKLTGPRTAALLVMIFSCASLGSPVVTWPIANRYMLFLACMLGLFYYLRAYTQCPARPAVVKAVLCVTVASFLYEQGVLAALAALIGLAAAAKKRRLAWGKHGAGLMLIPLVLFIAFYLAHNFTAILAFQQYPNPHASSRLVVGGGFALVFLAWWVLTLFFPSLVLWGIPSLFGRLVSTVHTPEIISFLLGFFPAVVLAGVFFAAIRWRRVQHNALVFFLSTALLLIYPLVIAVGRGTVYGFAYTFNFGAYYAYIFYGYLTVAAACLIDPAALPVKLKKAVYAVLIFFVLHNGFYVFKLNYYLMAQSRVLRQYQQHLKRFIAAHKDEEDFSFRVDNDFDLFFLTPPMPMSAVLGDRRYLSTEHPKYILDLRQSGFYKDYLRQRDQETDKWYSF